MYAQIFFNRESGTPPDVAGRAVADLDDVLALGFQRKILIERGYAIYLGNAQTQFLCHLFQIILTEILILRLNILHDGNKKMGLILVGSQNLLHARVIVHTMSSLHNIKLLIF